MRCTKARSKSLTATAYHTAGNDDAANLKSSATFLTEIGLNISTFFGGIASAMSDFINISNFVIVSHESKTTESTETTSASIEATTETVTTD